MKNLPIVKHKRLSSNVTHKCWHIVYKDLLLYHIWSHKSHICWSRKVKLASYFKFKIMLCDKDMLVQLVPVYLNVKNPNRTSIFQGYTSVLYLNPALKGGIFIVAI